MDFYENELALREWREHRQDLLANRRAAVSQYIVDVVFKEGGKAAQMWDDVKISVGINGYGQTALTIIDNKVDGIFEEYSTRFGEWRYNDESDILTIKSNTPPYTITFK